MSHCNGKLGLAPQDGTFTKGIILNRPSDRMLEDDVNEGLKWRVWFGGDVQGLDSILPDIVCLHSLKSQEALDCSTKVIKDIQWTNFDDAKGLVKKGLAKCEDFWLMAGYAGWVFLFLNAVPKNPNLNVFTTESKMGARSARRRD